MFIPQSILDDRQQILQLLNVTCGREDTSHTTTSGMNEGYLLLVNYDGFTDMQQKEPVWMGERINVAPTAETTIALSHIEVKYYTTEFNIFMVYWFAVYKSESSFMIIS